MSTATQYEYEERAFLSEEQFLSIKSNLDQLSSQPEIDNKTSYFFVLPDKNLSLASSLKSTVIKYKAGQLGLGKDLKRLRSRSQIHL